MMATEPEKKTEQDAAHGEDAPQAEDAGRPSAEDLVPGLAEAVAEAEEAETSARIAELEAERDELKDKLMRALAETENVRRRAERDRKDAEAYGGRKLARDLLAVHDDLERAIGMADDALRQSHPGFLEGIELTHRELVNAFAKHRIEPIAPEIGERFDPNRHQAMFEAPVPHAEPGTVMQVLAKGFAISGQLLRPAQVGVAKAAPAPSADGAQGSDGGDADAAPTGGGSA